MNFGDAVSALKDNKRVARSGWNGKKMWLCYVSAGATHSGGPAYHITGDNRPEDVYAELLPWIGMRTADNSFVPWLASQTDILAEDWDIVVV